MAGSGYAIGLAIASYEWMAALTLLIVGKFFLPIFLKNEIYTMPQFLEQRFGRVLPVLMAVFYKVIDIQQNRRWCKPFVWIGMNAITIYLLVHFVKLHVIAKCFTGGEVHKALDGVWHGLGDLATALLALFFAVWICRFLHMRKIFLKV